MQIRNLMETTIPLRIYNTILDNVPHSLECLDIANSETDG